MHVKCIYMYVQNVHVPTLNKIYFTLNGVGTVKLSELYQVESEYGKRLFKKQGSNIFICCKIKVHALIVLFVCFFDRLL